MPWNRRREAIEENSITEGVIWKQLLIFFFPILLGSFFQQMYNTADAMIVGKYVGKEALAAVGGATGSLINLIVGFFMGVSSGATVMLSQVYGARNGKDVSDTLHTNIAMGLLFGTVLMVAGIILSPTLLGWMGTPPEIFDNAVTYIRIYFGGMIPSALYNIGSASLRAVGDSRRPLYFLIAACMTNIVLDVILVVGLDMGVAGAALATILSQAVSAVLVILTLCRSRDSYQLHLRQIRIHTRLMRGILRIGLPAGLQSVMYSLSNVIIQSSMNAFGTDVLAAWTAYGKLDGLFWMIVSAFGVSITTFVGQNFGAQLYDRVRKSVKVCLGMAFGATIVLSTAYLLVGQYLYRLFADDPVVIAHGMDILRLLVPTYVLYLCIEIISGTVRGAGDSLIPTLITLCGVCLIRVVWLLFIAPGIGTMQAVLVSYPITWGLTSCLFLLYYWKGGWLQRCIKKAGFEA
ncbi:MAG: MATE family efflux transporter [Clostridia bacterium]|nr:MATE family efflux transporter [Clostridia bacterium]